MINIFLVITYFFITPSCTEEKIPEENLQIPEIKNNHDNIRISWDYNTKVKIAPSGGRNEAYCGYARLEQLNDGSLACVYETSSGNVELVNSYDLGKTWSEPQIVFGTKNNINMAVPDIIELSDHSILVACNPRPREPYTDDRKFGIKVRKSADSGKTWQKEQLIYEAQSTFNDGCWEPCFAQLPNGEVHLYFSNEGVYTTSNEQNISLFRSNNSGDNWTLQPEIVGFRENRRDGMPVPLVLEDKGEILVSIEDNKQGEFKPTIYHEKIADNWSTGGISADDSRRDYHPLKDLLSDEIYGGGPFLARLNSGEVLLSYQSTWERSNIWDRSCMVVEVGNDSGTLFSNRSIPFIMPITKWGLWNSLSIIENGTIPIALTSTNAYSYNSTEVWMIKGHTISEFTIPNGTATIDGKINDDCWQHNWPYFLGQQGETQMRASMCADESTIFLAFQINNIGQIDGKQGEIIFQLDTERRGYEKPHEGIFSFKCDLDGTIEVEEGTFGLWKKSTEFTSIQYSINDIEEKYLIELSIPLSSFKTRNKQMGVNFQLNYKKLGGNWIEESIQPNNNEQPFTWCPLNFN